MKENNASDNKNVKKRFVVPDAFIIIFGIVLLGALATYLIPAGSYERETVDNITKVVPGSYAQTASSPTSLMDLFRAVQTGLVESAPVIFLVFIIGGAIHVIQTTGALASGINRLVAKTKGNYVLLIAVTITVFSILATFGVLMNVALAFVPIGIMLARSLNLDRMTGFVTAYLGFAVGFLGGIGDPTVLGFAQTLADVPFFSGIWLRIILYLVILSVSIWYVVAYAKKIKKDPSKSITGKLEMDSEDEVIDENTTFTGNHKLIIFTFFLFIAIFLFGAFTYEWDITEMSAIFIMIAITVAFISKMTPNKFIGTFVDGAKSVTYGALVVGIARAVIVVLEDGKILDTIVHGALVPLESLPLYASGVLLYLFNAIFNILVTSGSGQAAIVMPLMIPIGDSIGLTRQTVVFMFKLGDGVTNIITPTAGGLMAALAVGKVDFVKWFRFIYPLVLIWVVILILFAIFAIAIGYS